LGMQFIFLLISALMQLVPLPAPSQMDPGEEELLAWSAARKLVWDDFKGTPDARSGAAASTATKLGFDYSVSKNEFAFSITLHFSKTRSWAREKNDHILRHEQGHFDIAEIFARKLYKKMKSYRFHKNTYRHDVNKIYDDILKDKDSMQQQYDEETDFSRNKEKQAEWLKKIASMLEELKAYAGYMR
jgi:hypothetical protein